MSKIQAVIFDKDYFDTSEARSFLKRHNLRPIKPVHKTDRYLRYRLIVPDKDRYYYRTKKIADGIKIVLAYSM